MKMQPQLETLLEAEAYFYRAMGAPNNDVPSYEDFQRFAGAVDFAYNGLNPMRDANTRLERAKGEGMLRQRREGIPNRVLPIKAAILIGSAQLQLTGLRRTAAVDQDVYPDYYRLLDRYYFEIGYNVLRAYNSLLELDNGSCTPAGSLLLLVDGNSGKVIDDRTGQPVDLRYDRQTGITYDPTGKIVDVSRPRSWRR